MAWQAFKNVMARWRHAQDQASAKRLAFKIVVMGPSSVSLRQYIATISETDIQPGLKSALTMGRLTITPAADLYLFHCVGGLGSRNFVLQMCKDGALGVVLVLDSAQPESFHEVLAMLIFLQSEIATALAIPFVVVVNHRYPQPNNAGAVEELRLIAHYYTNADVLMCNVMNRPSVYATLHQLLLAARATPTAVAAPAAYQALAQLVEKRAVTPVHTFDIAVVGHFHAGKTQYITTLTNTVSGAGFLGWLPFSRFAAAHVLKWPSAMDFQFNPRLFEKRLLGVVLVIDCARPESFNYAKAMLDFFRRTPAVPLVVVANHYPQPPRECHLADLRPLVRAHVQTELVVWEAAKRSTAYEAVNQLLAVATQTPAALAAPFEYQALARLVATRANAAPTP